MQWKRKTRNNRRNRTAQPESIKKFGKKENNKYQGLIETGNIKEMQMKGE